MGSTQSTWGIFVQAVRMSAGELGCTYAALILHDDGQEVTEEKMKQLLNAAKVDFEAYWPGLFVRALGSKDLNELIATPACGGGAMNYQTDRSSPLEMKDSDALKPSSNLLSSVWNLLVFMR